MFRVFLFTTWGQVYWHRVVPWTYEIQSDVDWLIYDGSA